MCAMPVCLDRPFLISVTTPTGTAQHVIRAVSAQEALALAAQMFPTATVAVVGRVTADKGDNRAR
jgi:hypothetical protein